MLHVSSRAVHHQEHGTVSAGTIFQVAGDLHPLLCRERVRHQLFISFEDTNTENFLFTGFEFGKKAVSMVLADIF